MNDLSSSHGEGDQNAAKESGDVAGEELKRTESDVAKAQASKNSFMNVYKRKNKDTKFEQVQVEPEKEPEKVEERSILGKQLCSGEKEQKQKTTEHKAKDMSGLVEQPGGGDNDQKQKKQKTTESKAKNRSGIGGQPVELKAKDVSDFSKQRGGGKKVDKQKETGAKMMVKAKSSQKKALRNEVSNNPMDNKEDHKMKRKEKELKVYDDKKKKRKEYDLKEDEDNNKKKKAIKLEVEAEMESKVRPEGNEQRERVCKKNKVKDEKSKEKKVKAENGGRKGQNQDGKNKQKLVESKDCSRNGHIEDGKKKQKAVDYGNDSEDEKENGISETTLYKFPMNRVSKIIRNEEFNGRLASEAIFLINKASEKFLELFTKEAYASAFLDHKTHISYDHLSSVVYKRKRLDFLSDFVPEKVKGEDALKAIPKDDDDDEDMENQVD